MDTDKSSMTKRTTRRKLVKALAAAPLLPSLIAATPRARGLPEIVQPTVLQQTEVGPSPVARALTDVVRSRYGQYLTPEQFNEVQGEIERGLRISERLRARKLKNSDEPDFVFSATQ